MENSILAQRAISIGDGRRLNFALARSHYSDSSSGNNSYNLLACTYDAKWNNKCELHPIELINELKWLTLGSKYEFDMAEGMCAHAMVLTDEYIAFSCSKMFQDGSARKLRVLSLSARTRGRPTLILEQSTPVDKFVMVSPSDGLGIIRSSPKESTVIYTVGSTVVSIKIVANGSNVSWRSWIDSLNTCHAT